MASWRNRRALQPTCRSRRAQAHLPVLSRRLFGVCKRHLDYYLDCYFLRLVLLVSISSILVLVL